MKYKMSSNNSSNPDVDRPMNLVWDYSDISIMETFFVFTSSKICSICEGPFFKDKITTPDCNHWMHQVCYMEFCKTNSHCATCKRFFNQMYYTNHSLVPFNPRLLQSQAHLTHYTLGVKYCIILQNNKIDSDIAIFILVTDKVTIKISKQIFAYSIKHKFLIIISQNICIQRLSSTPVELRQMKRASLADRFSALDPDITWIIEARQYFTKV